jgi:DNA-binding PadR family transcriptional regulator
MEPIYRPDTSIGCTLHGIMLELAILGLLKEQELHGYELKKRLVGTLGFASGVSFGSLYPALARLESAGAVKGVESRETVRVPHTGSLGGELATLRGRKPSGPRGSRGKKVYGITERGEQLFEELLAAETQSSDDDRIFNLRLAFARYLPPDARIGMLERRRAHLVERLIQLRARVQAARDGYARSLVEHDRETAEHDLSWVERLIAAERAGRHGGSERTTTAPRPSPPRPSSAHAGGPAAGHGPTISGLRPSTQPQSPQEDSNT